MADTHIKIKPVTPRVQYTANGSTTVFPYSFAIFDETDMVVYVDDTIITTGYTVSGAGQTDGGEVTFDSAPVDGTIITLLRNVPIERMTDFQEGGTFRPKNINDEFDRQTAFAQQVQEALGRCVKVDPTSASNPEEILPKIERLYESADNIDIVANDKANVDAVAGNQTNIDAVAGNQTNIDEVAGMSSDISTVANISQAVSSVADNETNINKVADDKSNIDAVASELPDVKTKANKSLDNLDAAGQAVINGKVDLNAANLSTAGKSLISGFPAPSLSSENLTLGATGSDYLAPATGWFVINKKTTAAGQYIAARILDVDYYDITWGPNFNVNDLALTVFVKKGDTLRVFYSAGGDVNKFSFIYSQGEV